MKHSETLLACTALSSRATMNAAYLGLQHPHLAEVTHMEDVQFIHQSVKDFVEKGLSALGGSLTSAKAAIRA